MDGYDGGGIVHSKLIMAQHDTRSVDSLHLCFPLVVFLTLTVCLTCFHILMFFLLTLLPHQEPFFTQTPFLAAVACSSQFHQFGLTLCLAGSV